jgi:hypothetical protein
MFTPEPSAIARSDKLQNQGIFLSDGKSKNFFVSQ